MLLGFLFSGYVMSAQAYPALYNNNEIKLNIGLFLATTTVEGSYEYYFSEDASIGATIYFDDDATDFNGNFGIGPNFRAYFGYQPEAGSLPRPLAFTTPVKIKLKTTCNQTGITVPRPWAWDWATNGLPGINGSPWKFLEVWAEISIPRIFRTTSCTAVDCLLDFGFNPYF